MPGYINTAALASMVNRSGNIDMDARRAEIREFLRNVNAVSNNSFAASMVNWYGTFSTNEPDIMPRKLSKFQKFVKRVEHEPSNGRDLQSSHDDG